ncbi:hypothetical protein SLS60_011817 [Paraconiothyrium brasiliense]|uniref:Mid2 domain-containing protein n=1 Tax=Paraconiothyrium brasiliense TaxID=300254 RepID=A0ABR3QI94_9PLEO
MGSNDCCDDNDAQLFEFGSPHVIATAGKTVAQATGVPKAQNDQTTTSDRPQATQGQQQDVSLSAMGASSTGEPDEPEATDSTKAITSGDTAKADATKASQSDATGTIARTASQSDSSNTASPVAGSGSDPAATNAINDSKSNNGNSNHTVAIAVGVGVGVGIVVFLLSIAGCWHIRRKRQRPGLRSKNLFEIGESSTPAMEVADNENNNSGARLGEKGRGSNIYELDGGARGAELPAGNEAEEVHGESADSKKWPSMFR